MKIQIQDQPQASSVFLRDGIALLAAAGAPKKYQRHAAYGLLLWKIGTILWNKLNTKKHTLHVTIDNGNPYHKWISIWMSKTPPLETNTDQQEFALSGNNDTTILVPTGTTLYRFEDTAILVETKSTTKKDTHYELQMARSEYYPDKTSITFYTTNKDLVNRFLEHVREIGENYEHIPSVKIRKWNDWIDTQAIPKRMPILPQGMFQKITDDITSFLEKKDWYESVGIPWRRGYLFYGVPGSGKTTTAIALANFLGCDIYILDLGQVSSETVLSAMNSVPEKSILLLEDLDCAFSDRAQPPTGGSMVPADEGKLTLSTFLNALDGVATRDGRILIATTNHPEILDEAIKRRGRLDRDFPFGYACQSQIRDLADRFGVPLLKQEILSWTGLPMAEVQEKLLEILNKINPTQSNIQ